MREVQRLAEAPLRRPWLVIVPAVLVHLAALGAAIVLPPRYSSSTLILIAPEQMPASLVPQLGAPEGKNERERTGARLQTLRQEVQSRTRLEMIARELDPYGSLGKEPLIDTIERLRDNVIVSVKGNDAFSIEFQHRDPRMAMLVADRLTMLFMEEVVGARERQVSTAYSFLEREMQDARRHLEEKERALRDFKTTYMGQLPEQVQANLATLQRLQLEQQMVADNLRKAQDTLLLMESTGQGPEPAATPPDSLSGMRALLAQLRTRYTDRHPDIVSLEARIKALEKEQASAAPGEPAVDPVKVAAERRQREAKLEIDQLKARLADIDRRIASFQGRVEVAPRREQEVLGLMRDYQKLSENYSQLLSKKLDAEMVARLEQQQRGQQFRILDPAYLPERPSFPNRLMFGLWGAVGGLALGLALAVGIDVLDPTMKDADAVAAAFKVPVLAVVPYVKPREQSRLATLPIDGPRRGEGRRMLRFGRGEGSGEPRARAR
jgi:polysaccharide chain length determinant protein (PEP-CTERM system associated)